MEKFRVLIFVCTNDATRILRFNVLCIRAALLFGWAQQSMVSGSQNRVRVL